MTRFRHLNIPDQYNHYFTKYPEGYTILEALIQWTQQVDNLIDNVNEWNKYLESFIQQFDKELQKTVVVVLQDWYENGLLSKIINEEVFKMKADKQYVEDMLAQKASLKDITFGDISQPLSTISPKIIRKMSDNQYNVLCKRPSHSGFTMLTFTKGSGISADGTNYGANWDLFRLSGVYGGFDAVAYTQPSEFTSSKAFDESTNDFVKQNLVTEYTSPTNVQFLTNNTRNKNGNYIEFTARIQKNQNGLLQLAFLAGTSASRNVEVTVNGELVGTLDLQTNPQQVISRSVDVSKFLGNVTVRLTINSATGTNMMHFLGYNFYHISQMVEGLDYTNAMYTALPEQAYISQSIGANDYALKEYNGKWMGSYHGGEKLIDSTILLDGINIKDNPSQYFFGKKFEIVQSTNLADKITTHSIVNVLQDAVYNFNAYFDVKTDFDVSHFYTCMTCSNEVFNQLLYPKFQILNDEYTYLPDLTKVVQRNYITGQQIITMYTPNRNIIGNKPLHIWHQLDNYYKVYHAKVVESKAKMESIGFGSTKIFD